MRYRAHAQIVQIGNSKVKVFSESQHNAVVIGAMQIGYPRGYIVDVRKRGEGEYQMLLITGEWLPVKATQAKEYQVHWR